MIKIFAAVATLLCLQPAVTADNLALLSGTLKTYQRAACDEETMTLRCPPGTTISVTLAQYGRAGVASISKCSTPSPPPTIDKEPVRTCLWPRALEYSLLQTVVEACQKKRQCKFNTSPETFQGDPCPGLPKYIEIAYKCRPYEFRSKIACENDNVNLICNPGSRVAIYGATYGRTQYESLQCPQPQGVPDETCLMSHATETVMQLCHGKRRCSLTADSQTFGKPCRPDSKVYLKVVYTCVPRKVLREQYEGAVEADEMDLVDEFEEGFDRADFRAEFSPSPNLEGPQPQPRDNSSRDGPTVSSSPPRARTNNDENQEKFYLYIIVSVTAGILLFLGLVIGRLLVSRHRAKRDAKFHANNEALPNGFTDDISEIDADIDLTTPVPVPMQDSRIPETQLAERLHGDRYYSDARMPIMAPTPVHSSHIGSGSLLHGHQQQQQLVQQQQQQQQQQQHHHHISNAHGVRIDLGNHMVGTDNLHTILRSDNQRTMANKSYYYG
ncbi:protein eva-1 homolog C-like isoform X5 [Athalia rosae]|uniref:protein eva-1 homolog C-like isoform X5 n=1 Tax=Athalia rosae TaxID=37344 RepID=UPI0020339EE3|nr:protein eva-1 homolog C-like isoform X5 [Athalia rosae]